MKLGCAVVLLGLLGAAGLSNADSLPRRGDIDPRIRTAMYNANEVYRLSGFVGYLVDLEFESDELFVGISAGDPEASRTARTTTCSPCDRRRPPRR